MSDVCRLCGLAIAPSAILGQNVHVPIDSREVMRALKCPSYGNAQPDTYEDIPAIWRSDGHLNALWERSK